MLGSSRKRGESCMGPDTLTWTDRGEMAIGGVAVAELVERYGTPTAVG